MKRRWHPAGKSDPNQLRIEWNVAEGAPPVPPPSSTPAVTVATVEEPATPAAPPPDATKLPKVRRRSATGPGGNRIVARFPVPRPLAAAITAGRFGTDEEGRPIRPAPDEVRAITENQAEKLIDMLDALTSRPGNPATADTLPDAFGSIIAAYAQDFGDRAARQLEAYARRQASLDESDRGDERWHR